MIVRGPFFTGGAKGALRQLESLREAGVGVIDVDIVSVAEAINYAEQASALERFGRDVLPEIRSW